MVDLFHPIKAIFIGTSAGGVMALNTLFKMLPAHFKVPIIAVLHLGDNELIPTAFHSPVGVKVIEAEEKETIQSQHIYFAPAGYHLLVENDYSFSLSTEEKVQYARPSLDVSMESLAEVYGKSLLGIVLTGANEDGAFGLLAIKKAGGLTVAQSPDEAEYKTMPMSAIKKADPHHVLHLKEIGELIAKTEGMYE
jgi:two-component system, chemotaxis family, protein-glutamate methylesterase/glutaminase